MERNDKSEELISSLAKLEQLQEVPTQVSVRFHETLSGLVAQESKKSSKKSWLTSSNQFALAASFVLVFAIGVVINLEPNSANLGQVSQNEATSSSSPTNSEITEDQIQYSDGSKSTPEVSDSQISISNSKHNYVDIPMDFYKKIGVTSSWNATRGLDEENLRCLRKLELANSTNLIDTGTFEGKTVRAVWAPVTRSSWNVYIVDSTCSALEKKYVQG